MVSCQLFLYEPNGHPNLAFSLIKYWSTRNSHIKALAHTLAGGLCEDHTAENRPYGIKSSLWETISVNKIFFFVIIFDFIFKSFIRIKILEKQFLVLKNFVHEGRFLNFQIFLTIHNEISILTDGVKYKIFLSFLNMSHIKWHEARKKLL